MPDRRKKIFPSGVFNSTLRGVWESLSDLTQMSRKSVLFLACPRSAIAILNVVPVLSRVSIQFLVHDFAIKEALRFDERQYLPRLSPANLAGLYKM